MVQRQEQTLHKRGSQNGHETYEKESHQSSVKCKLKLLYGMAKMEKMENTNGYRTTETHTPFTWWCTLVQAAGKTAWECLINLNMCVSLTQ